LVCWCGGSAPPASSSEPRGTWIPTGSATEKVAGSGPSSGSVTRQKKTEGSCGPPKVGLH
jgi:hypothetical protein